MSIFIGFGLLIALLSTTLLLYPLWQQPHMLRRKKIAISLICILFMMVFGFGLYGYVGAPMIVLFTA